MYFLLRYLLNRPAAEHPWIFERCREVQAAPNGFIDLWAREHWKSSIITFALTIQEILNDPEVTVGIFSHTRPVAKAFLRQIKVEFETNGALKDLFPNVLWAEPKKQSPKWSEDEGIIVRRTTNPPESTVEAWGLVDGQPTGRHFKRLLYDDVVTDKSVTTPEMMRKVTDAWRLSLNLGAQGGVRRIIGTRYHMLDTYGEILKQGSAVQRLYPATEDGTETGNPILMAAKDLADKRRDMGPYIFGAQMLLDPVADKVQGFREEWLRFWDVASWRGMNRYILCDPAGEKKAKDGHDPDYTVFAVIGLGFDQNYYTITWIRDRLNLTERTKLLFELHRTYKPLGVGYEKYGKDSDIEHIQYVQEQENYRFEIKALGGPMPKHDRIKKLVPIYEQGRMYLPRTCIRITAESRAVDMTKSFIEDEYLIFPVARHEDMLDCQARIVDPELQVAWPETPKESETPDWAKKVKAGQKRGTTFMSR